MNSAGQIDKAKDKAQRLLALHQGPKTLIIANAWDAGSARMYEAAGAQAIASTSAGIANAQGYPDGEHIPRAAMLAIVQRMVETVALPVSADMETGYSNGGRDIDSVVATCRGVLDAGAVGVNLEDTSSDPEHPLVDAELQVKKLRAVRAMADTYGVHLVINARIDSYWLNLGDEKTRLAETARRAAVYREAGADCVFVPGMVDAAAIRTLLAASPGPLNILAMPGCPDIAGLEALGVTRLSQGSGPARAALALTRRIAEELFQHGTYEGFQKGNLPYAEVNNLFKRQASA
jgi:2-methylisocitrate lyase-like PEP mutase family enzyme